MTSKRRTTKQLGIFDEKVSVAQFSGTCTCQTEWSDSFIRKFNTSQIGEIVYCACGNAKLPFIGKVLLSKERAKFIEERELTENQVWKIWRMTS